MSSKIFKQRITAPTPDNPYYYDYNPFYASGYGMPNCTAYAWGRFYEAIGERPTLSLGNAEDWYGYNDGYERGQTPRLGAVLCWRKGVSGDNSDGAGHVAFVEKINSDGTIVTSESGYQNENFWWTKTRKNDGNWSGGAYVFQGFIYPPINFINGGYIDNLKWIAGNYWLSYEEQQNNAIIIYRYLYSKGWSKNAIAAVLGNMQGESRINPGVWENLTSDPEQFKEAHGRYPGFGLVQWTPYTKYSNWAGEDWMANYDKQLDRLVWELENGSQYSPTDAYPETFKEFSVSQKTPYYLACAFLYNYERPLYPNPEERGGFAEKWYDFIGGIPVNGLPVWLLFKFVRRF